MATKPPGLTDPFSEAEENPLPVKQTLMQRLNAGSGIPMVDEALKRDFMQKQAQANLYHSNAAQLNGLLLHLSTPEGKTHTNPQTGQPYTDDDIDQLKLQRDHAWGQYEKLVGIDKQSKGALQKAKTIIDFIHGNAAKRAGMSPPPTPDYPTTVGEGGVTQTGVTTPRQGPVSTPSSFASNVGNAGVSYDASKAQQLTPPPLSPLQESARASTQLPFATHPAKVGQAISDALQSEQAQFKQGIAQRKDVADNVLHLDPKSREYDYFVATGKMPPVFRPPRPAGVYSVSVLDAMKRIQNGEVFVDTNGEPIDVSKLDSTMGLKGMQVLDPDTGNWTVRYEPFSPNQSTVNVGNEVYAVSPMDKSKLVTGAGTALGPQHVATTSTHTAPGVTLGGEIGTVTTGSTRTPATVGIPGRTQATPTAPRPGGISIQPVPQGSIGQPGATRKSGAATVPISSATPRGSSNEQAIPFGAANQLNQRIIPVREAATQLFGDPTQPDFKGFQEYAPLADNKNKDEREALANAVRLTLDHMKGEERSAGSLTTLLGNYLGKPQALVDSETSVMKDTIGKLSPQNQEAYNAVMSVYGTVMGLRSLTRASSHQFSVEALEREIPLPGINAFSQQQFYDKMSRLAEQVYNGSKTVPLPQKEKDFYAGKVKEYRQLAMGRSGGTPAPPTPESSAGPTGPPKTADDYLAKFGIKPKQ